MVGKKGRNYSRFLGRETARELIDLGDDPRFDQIASADLDRVARTLLVPGERHGDRHAIEGPRRV